MKLILNILIFYLWFTQFVIVNTSSSSSSSSSNPAVTLIVNPNIKNTNYTVGEYCGSIDSTCNSIGDAISFFNTIAKVEHPNILPYIFQPLNLLLADGVYGLKESSVELFQYNINISPLNTTSTTQQVVFDGQINFINQTLFEISTPDDIDSTNISTLVSISGITFRNFKFSIVDVATQASLTNVTFDNCYFENFISSINNKIPTTCIPMIQFYQNTNQAVNSFLTITNSFIQNSINSQKCTANPDLISLVCSNAVVSNLQVTSISGFNSVINGDYFSKIFIDSSLFQYVSTSYGSISIRMGSNLTMTNSVFNGGYSVYGGASIYVVSSSNIGSTFSITGCTFKNGISKNGCGVISGASLLSSGLTYPISYITNSAFSYNNGSQGGAISVTGIPIEIVGSTFVGNSASFGGTFQLLQGSVFEVKNSTIITDFVNTRSFQIYGGSIGVHDSTILLDQCTFSTHNFTSIWCDKSTVTITNEVVKLRPFYICGSCNQLSVNQESICTISSSTTTTGGSESSSGSDASSIYKNSNPIGSTILLLLSFLFISFINFY